MYLKRKSYQRVWFSFFYKINCLDCCKKNIIIIELVIEKGGVIMKYLKQFLIIILFSLIGELLHYLLPFPIPASIYGLVLLFASLVTGIVKLDKVQGAAKYLIEIMPIMFVPAGVGLMEKWGVLKPMLIPVVTIITVSTILVMGISGRVTQIIIEKKQEAKG